MHFAALAYVGESVTEPKLYFENNVAQGLGLLDGLLQAGVKRFVFSSTCATYGEPVRVPIDESHPQAPVNPYGWSKLFMEKILSSYDHAYGLRFVALRYFNAAGATRRKGEHHNPETHLIPNVLAAAAGRRPFVSVFGDSYPTPDGTCIRDYIHILDLGQAHILALDPPRSEFYNIGTGGGTSVREVIDTCRRITGHEIPVVEKARRAGDPPRLIAASEKIKRELRWEPRYQRIDAIIESAWKWHQKFPNGYGD